MQKRFKTYKNYSSPVCWALSVLINSYFGHPSLITSFSIVRTGPRYVDVATYVSLPSIILMRSVPRSPNLSILLDLSEVLHIETGNAHPRARTTLKTYNEALHRRAERIYYNRIKNSKILTKIGEITMTGKDYVIIGK